MTNNLLTSAANCVRTGSTGEVEMSELQELTNRIMKGSRGTVFVTYQDYQRLQALAPQSAEYVEITANTTGEPGFNYRITIDQPFYYTVFNNGSMCTIATTDYMLDSRGQKMYPNTDPNQFPIFANEYDDPNHECGLFCGCPKRMKKVWGILIFLLILDLFTGGGGDEKPPIDNTYDGIL